MPIPSKGFVNSLHGLDPLLHVYWGESIQQWVIARKSVIPSSEVGLLIKRHNRLKRLVQTYDGHPNGLQKLDRTRKEVAEQLYAAKNGRRVILYSRFLNQELYDALVLADMQRYGGYSFYADKLEQEEAAAEKELERRQAEQRIAMNKEVHSMLNFVWRKRESELLHGERDMGKLLHGKSSPGPLIQLTDF